MGLSKDRLNYLYQYLSEREISRQTGIPRSTLYDWKVQNRNPSQKVYNYIRSTYERLVYRQFRDLGATSKVADYYKWYSPSSITERLSYIDRVSSHLAKLAKDRAYKKYGTDWSMDFYDQYFNKAKQDISENLTNSQKSYEQWEDS